MRFARTANCAILQAMVCWKVGKTRMIRSVEKAMAIVNFVAEQAEPVSLGRIAAALQCPSTTCAHLVETLCAGHYLEKVSRKDGYALGPRMYLNTSGRFYREELVRVAAPVMTQLCRNVSECVSLNCFANGRMYVLYTVLCQDEGLMRVGLQGGMLYSSAAGRLFLAAMNEREVDAVVQENGLPDGGDWEGVNTRTALDAELKKIRACGYAIRETTDLVAVSCPVHQGGALAAGIGVYLPPERFTGAHRMQIINLTNEAGILITRRLYNREKCKSDLAKMEGGQ